MKILKTLKKTTKQTLLLKQVGIVTIINNKASLDFTSKEMNI